MKRKSEENNKKMCLNINFYGKSWQIKWKVLIFFVKCTGKVLNKVRGVERKLLNNRYATDIIIIVILWL